MSSGYQTAAEHLARLPIKTIGVRELFAHGVERNSYLLVRTTWKKNKNVWKGEKRETYLITLTSHQS